MEKLCLMKKYITTNTRKTILYAKVGGNDVHLDFLTVIINIHEKNGTRVASLDNQEIWIIRVWVIEVRLY